MTTWTRRAALWVPVAIYMATIFYLSSLQRAPLPPGVGDKPAHAAGYFGLAVVVVRAVAGGLPRRIGPGRAIAALAISVVYAASDELHQSFVPGRTAEISDLCADALGALAGTGVCWAWGIIAPAFGTPESPRHDL